jgi:hypothetical protein
MRAYDVGATSVTLGVNRKWLDNVLSHHRVPGVLQERQGISRRVTPAGLLRLEVSAILSRTMSIPIGQALELAGHLIAANGSETPVAGAPSIRIAADIDAIVRELEDRLGRAVEMSPSPKRGRPRRK